MKRPSSAAAPVHALQLARLVGGSSDPVPSATWAAAWWTPPSAFSGQVIPTKIEAESSPISAPNAPQWSNLTYHMPASAKQQAMTVTWNDGSKDGVPGQARQAGHDQAGRLGTRPAAA